MTEVPVKALKKGLEVLNILIFGANAESGYTLKDLAARLAIPANSAHNLLKTLAACGYAEKNHLNRYIAGRVCRQIAFANFQNDGAFREKVTLALQKLVENINANVVFATLERNTWRTVLRMDADGRTAATDPEEVQRQYLYETATGRVLCAFSSPRRRAELLTENPGQQTAWPEMETDIAKIRAQGGCALLRERYKVYSYAVPVRRGRRLVGALGAYCRPEEHNPLHDRHIFTLLRQTAGALAQA